MTTIFLFIILALVVGGAIFYWSFILPKKRLNELTAYAAELGFSRHQYIATNPKDDIAPLRLFCLEPSGGDMKNVFIRTEPKLMIFDYEYDIPRDQTVRQTAALFETNGGKWPKLVVETKMKERFTVQFMRSLTQKLANWMSGYEEIDLSLYPEFAQHYRVFSSVKLEHVSDLVAEKTQEVLMQYPGWTVEAMDQWTLMYHQGKKVKPNELKSFVDEAMHIYASLG
ncbi:MAG: hypothetical protein JXO49_02640 [Deltaproteobacteria bacterium]|nr:hypothetical protein [Candidatus Anaeroferrophillus wilburensis]MBN2888226.1 hypothetical protein [Deltaproteobacteria bacterium]